jgi:hypothetical protein
VDRFNSAREQALSRKHELTIHREAIGIRFHKDMEMHYPVPEKKDYILLKPFK